MALQVIKQNEFLRTFESLAGLYRDESCGIECFLEFTSSISLMDDLVDSSDNKQYENYQLASELKKDHTKAQISQLLHSGSFM